MLSIWELISMRTKTWLDMAYRRICKHIIIDVYVFIYNDDDDNDDDDDDDGDYDNNDDDDDDDTYFNFIDGFMLMGYPVPMSTWDWMRIND